MNRRTAAAMTAMALLLSCACAKHPAGEGTPAPTPAPAGARQRVTFTAEVVQVTLIDEPGGFMPVTADPRFRLVLDVQSASHPDFPFQSGIQVLGIHSPALLQLTAASVDHTYRFSVDWTPLEGGAHALSGLRNDGEVE